MKTLTVITTTYNRDYCLHQVYESLLRQSCDDFVWMVVDDGSTDGTRELVEKWILERKIEIEYIYKPNGGMHTARNTAYSHVQTELNVIIDSDDWMTDDAVETIVAFWRKNGGEKFYGIVANNIDTKGQRIGSPLPQNVKSCRQSELTEKYGVKGDKKIVLRSDLSKLYPFPEFPNEKFYPASYKYRLLDQNYELLLMDAYLCVVEYNDDSMTFNKYAQYRSCAKGFAHYRNEMIRISSSSKYIAKEMLHYIAESKFAGNKHYIKNSAKPIYAVLCWPFGLAYYFYLTHTRRKY